ncbi:hypothetical protein KSP39_PZI016961 [Platanthera zijinensis]|uniref:Uncharacterized protein n=1 Tax=Platanthera zijinensis TaxID=2320716 RepID=A0AAP0B7G9_9ASPA
MLDALGRPSAASGGLRPPAHGLRPCLMLWVVFGRVEAGEDTPSRLRGRHSRPPESEYFCSVGGHEFYVIKERPSRSASAVRSSEQEHQCLMAYLIQWPWKILHWWKMYNDIRNRTRPPEVTGRAVRKTVSDKETEASCANKTPGCCGRKVPPRTQLLRSNPFSTRLTELGTKETSSSNSESRAIAGTREGSGRDLLVLLRTPGVLFIGKSKEGGGSYLYPHPGELATSLGSSPRRGEHLAIVATWRVGLGSSPYSPEPPASWGADLDPHLAC